MKWDVALNTVSFILAGIQCFPHSVLSQTANHRCTDNDDIGLVWAQGVENQTRCGELCYNVSSHKCMFSHSVPPETLFLWKSV